MEPKLLDFDEFTFLRFYHLGYIRRCRAFNRQLNTPRSGLAGKFYLCNSFVVINDNGLCCILNSRLLRSEAAFFNFSYIVRNFLTKRTN